MMTDQELYGLTAIVMAVATLVFIAAIMRKPEEKRPYYLPILVVPTVYVTAFALMSQGILLIPQPGPQPPAAIARNVGYVVIWPTMAGFIAMVGALEQREIATVVVAMALVPFGVLSRWIPVAAIAALGSLFLFAGLFVLAYLLLGRYNGKTAGNRHLLFAKLRNLLLLLWVLYVVGALFVDSGPISTMDRFTSIFLANYLDLMAVTFFGLIVLRSDDAMDQVVAGENPALEETVSEQPETPQADAAD